MNVGTSKRTPCTAVGYENYSSVCEANLLLERPAAIKNSSKDSSVLLLVYIYIYSSMYIGISSNSGDP